ncbi:MAG: LCP family protein [Chloroflexota bacterium]
MAVMKNRFLRFSSATLIVLGLLTGLFWVRITADEAPVELAQLPSRGLQGGARQSSDIIIPTLEPTATPLETFTPIPTVTNTPPPNTTPTYTPRPTQTPKNTPTQAAVIATPDIAMSEFDNGYPPPEGVATPVEQIDMPSGVTNILLIGSDTPSDSNEPDSVRTDSLLIVSVNRDEATASILSIPRDLYLYIPGWRDSRINTAYARGEQVDYPGGGPKQLKDTILYNFGIPIHYYARIDFAGFEQVVDSLGGIEIVSSCTLTDWILKEPGLDIQIEDNWEMYTLEPGVHQMDGFTALWYARSRRTTSDFDRGRRQQQIMGAILEKGLDLNLLPQAPALWDSYQETVDTDMDLGKALQLAALAPQIEENGIQHLSLTRGEIEPYTIPNSGANVSRLVPDEAPQTLAKLYDVSGLNRSSRTPITVELVNRSSDPELGQIVAGTLEWFGIVAVVVDEIQEADEDNQVAENSVEIEYFGQNFKGSYNWLVSWIFDIRRGQVNLSDEESDYSYRVTLNDGFNACRNPLYAPKGG